MVLVLNIDAQLVTKDVKPWTVVGGNPAKSIKKRELEGASTLIHDGGNPKA